MWQKMLSLLGRSSRTADARQSQIIPTWTEPDGWECGGQFDTPRNGLPVTSLRELSAEAILRRRIRSTCPHIGSYGMGGPGFLGLELDPNQVRPNEWFVLCLWGAAQWCLFDGKPIESPYQFPDLPAFGIDAFSREVSGGEIIEASIQDKSCELLIELSGASHRFEIPSDTRRLPPYGGTGGRRNLAPQDSLWDAWVVSPTKYLYV
jgi:hypothetical protein